MAPIPEAYFPSLDKCFSGDVQLLYARFVRTIEKQSVLIYFLLDLGDEPSSIPATLTVMSTIQAASMRSFRMQRALACFQIA
jgi:hypothetical protein